MSLEILIGILIFVAVYYYLFAPLVSGQPESAQVVRSSADSIENLSLKKEEILLTLKDLEFDHELKKLSDDDFHHIYDETLQEGAQVLRQIDEEKARQEKASSVLTPTSQELKAAKFCSECGERLAASAKFCAQCGTKIG